MVQSASASSRRDGAADLPAQVMSLPSGNYLFNPAIQASEEGTVAMVMTLSGATFYPARPIRSCR